MYLQVLTLLVIVSVSQCLECTNQPIYITDGTVGGGVVFCLRDDDPSTCKIEDPASPFDTSNMRSVNVTSQTLATYIDKCEEQRTKRQTKDTSRDKRQTKDTSRDKRQTKDTSRDKRQTKDTSRDKRTTRWYLDSMYPGTKWCGEGNEAAGFEDLGDHRETDTCCRDHDNGCGNDNEIVLPLTCPSNSVCSMVQVSRHHCDCDDNFNACLKRVVESPSASADDKMAADTVGKTYFDNLGQTCYITETYVKVSHDVYFNEHYANATRHVWQDVSPFNTS